MQRTDAPFTPFSYCQIMNISVSDVALPHTILPCMGVRHSIVILRLLCRREKEPGTHCIIQMPQDIWEYENFC